MVFEGGGLAQWCQQVKRSLLADIVKELHDEVLDIGDDQRALFLGVR